MNIHLVPGTMTIPIALNQLERTVKKNIPNSEVVKAPSYVHLFESLVRKSIDDLVDSVNTQEPTLIIGHSFGGIIGRKALDIIDPNAEHTDKLHLITIATPHNKTNFDPLRINPAIQKLELPNDCPHLKTTFAGRFDRLVLPDAASMPKVDQILINSHHTGFLLFPWVRTQVCKHIAQIIKEQA